MIQKVFKTGNSLAITIPAKFVACLGIKRGDNVQVIEQKDKARIVYHFAGSRQLPLAQEFFKKMGKSHS
ncbi:MAG: AbrB/MazE/SpoVT family DNA-binding domain-containing protein [Candidatus Blackburnbacteria bacterium]|nr:AbrB/MazE/SpoVT family DNA-binding domain-containing protein [Candidatus Blackburnbacteria bacterium]